MEEVLLLISDVSHVQPLSKVVWSVVDPSQGNSHICSPTILFACEVNLDRRMLDEILNLNHKE